MLTNLIENRGREFTNLLKIGDYLARSLRENVELFFVDDGIATYVTESGSVITGKYHFKPVLKITNIEVEDSSILEDRDLFEKVADKKVSNLLANLMSDNYQDAEGSFDQILDLYETKLSFEKIKNKLREKVERFGESTKIIDTGEFQRVNESKDQIVKFLKENKQLANIPEIRNGMKLAMVISKAFDLPRITVEDLTESKKFEVKVPSKSTIYEHLCRQELVAKELLETKENFDGIWSSNEDIHELASLIYESDGDKVRHQVATVVSKIPYFALSTKKQIANLIRNSLSLSELKISNKDITSFVSNIYEMKKPVRVHLVKLLNEKYGININNLTEVPTFNNLVKTESVILTALGRLAPKNSVVKKSLLELSNIIKIKNGEESIDLANFLNDIFVEADYTASINETNLMSYLDFNKVADDLGKIGQVLKMIQPLVQGKGEGVPGEEGVPGMEGQIDPETGPADPLGTPDPMESGEEVPEEGGLDPEQAAADVAMEDAEEKGANPMEDDLLPDEGMEGEGGLPELGAEEGMEDEEGFEGEEDFEGEEEEPEGVDQVGEEELSDLVASVEDLIADLKAELGEPSDEDANFGSDEDFEDGESEDFEEDSDEEAFEDEDEEDFTKKKK